jgi:hypothetical protein
MSSSITSMRWFCIFSRARTSRVLVLLGGGGCEGGGTGLIGSTAVDHVQAVLAHSRYALALMFPTKA